MEIRLLPITHPDAQLLVEAVQQEYVVRYGSRDATPVEPGYFEGESGRFYVGYLDQVPVATGGWRRRTDLTALGSADPVEVKRMYVVEAARHRGLARTMLAHLELTAAQAGAEVVVLESGVRQPEALELYVSAGYQPIPAFGHYRDSPLSRCFGKRLDARLGEDRF